MVQLRRKFTRLFLVVLCGYLVLAGCRVRKVYDTWVPLPNVWDKVLERLCHAEFPHAIKADFHWPDSVKPQVDFFVADLNRFAVVLYWKHDTSAYYRAIIGQLTPNEAVYRHIHPRGRLDRQERLEVERLKAHDSSWTLLSETKFWERDRGLWYDALTDPAWMYEKYKEYVSWEHVIRIDGVQRRKK